MPVKDRYRSSVTHREALARMLSAALPGLDRSSALTLLQQSSAWHTQALFDLHDHLSAYW